MQGQPVEPADAFTSVNAVIEGVRQRRNEQAEIDRTVAHQQPAAHAAHRKRLHIGAVHRICQAAELVPVRLSAVKPVLPDVHAVFPDDHFDVIAVAQASRGVRFHGVGQHNQRRGLAFKPEGCRQLRPVRARLREKERDVGIPARIGIVQAAVKMIRRLQKRGIAVKAPGIGVDECLFPAAGGQRDVLHSIRSF